MKFCKDHMTVVNENGVKTKMAKGTLNIYQTIMTRLQSIRGGIELVFDSYDKFGINCPFKKISLNHSFMGDSNSSAVKFKYLQKIASLENKVSNDKDANLLFEQVKTRHEFANKIESQIEATLLFVNQLQESAKVDFKKETFKDDCQDIVSKVYEGTYDNEIKNIIKGPIALRQVSYFFDILVFLF